MDGDNGQSFFSRNKTAIIIAIVILVILVIGYYLYMHPGDVSAIEQDLGMQDKPDIPVSTTGKPHSSSK